MSDRSHDEVEARRARVKARANWPVKAYTLGSEPSEDLSATTTAEERLAMMWPLSKAAYELAFGEIPDIPRSEWPCRQRFRPPK